MSITTYNLTLDLQRAFHQVLVMKEGDHNSRKVIITFTENGQPFSLGDCSIDVRWRKPDQTIITPLCTKEDESSASFLCTEQMLLVPGIANVDAHIYNRDGLQLSTMPFQVSIKRSSVSNSELISSSEFQSLTKLMEDFRQEHNNVKTEVNRLKTDAENASKKSQSYAVGNTNSRPGENTDNANYYNKLAQSYAKGGTNIRSGEASDNAKYYKEQAQSSAQTSSTQAQAAASSATAAAASQTTAAQKASQAGTSAATASTKATESANSAVLSQSYAIGGTDSRTGEDTDNSKYYYQQSKSIYDNFSQAGTVTGLKGNAETRYRTGNVNLTPENIGAVNKSGDTVWGKMKFIRDGDIRFITPDDVTGGHARGMNFIDKNGTDIWGGIGVVGSAGILDGIYIGAGTTYPWSSANALYITDSSIKWKNSNLVTENSGIAKEAVKATQDGNGNVITDSYAVRKTISGGSFNDITTPGFYTITNASDSPTSASNKWALLALDFEDNARCQMAFPYNDYGLKVIYIRSLSRIYNNYTWMPWQCISSWQSKDIVDLIYPVGSIYMSVNSTSPATLFGGTWVRWGNGRVPVSVNESETEFNTVEKVGGEKIHAMTTAEMPSHTHSVKSQTATTSTNGKHTHSGYSNQDIASGTSSKNRIVKGGDNTISGFLLENGDHNHTVTIPASTTGSNGNGVGHNNLQPYITCYMWKRTA